MFGSRPNPLEILFGIFILGAFLYGTYEMNRSGARAVEFNKLRDRVLKHVGAHPEKDKFTLDDLQQDGVLSGDDLEFLSRNNITYHPFGAKSANDTICFVQKPSATEERRYRRDGNTEYYRIWISPNQAYQLVSAAKPELKDERLLTLVNLANGNVLWTSDAAVESAQVAHWSADSRLLAVTTHHSTKNPYVNYTDCGFLLEVTPQGVQSLPVPMELRPDHILANKHPGKEIRWSDHWVRPLRWNQHTLIVESQGLGRIKSGSAEPDLSFNAIYRLEVQVANGRATIARQSQKHYAEVPCK